ncbi:hypothetical protein [Archangium lansingense]|uniref:Uncharacterized protein n=1 Tax=Archangium lansingense TaxID=2995310 RepID=A0ABT4ALD9_9BACT|nr:hypothetical protein [Archangium lansinium]MCY1082515.1 hypothetical protein [Archangium lansinium]
MARHQLIISRELSRKYPIRSEAGQSKVTSRVVVNWKGTWEPDDQPEMYLVVAPQDEIEIVLQPDEFGGAGLWFFKQEEQKTPLFRPTLEPGRLIKKLATSLQSLWDPQSEDEEDRVDIESGSRILEVNHMLAGDSGESRYSLRLSGLGQRPVPIGGQGQPGSLTASKP